MTENLLAKARARKIIINVGVKEALTDKKILESMSSQLAQITGQKPIATYARKAIAAFKLRKGDPIGLKVTLRGRRMNDFLTKLVSVVLPRVRDFKGVSPLGFDGRGNYTLGIKELLVFPEIDFAKIEKVRGLEVTFVTTAKNDEEGRRLLEEMGMPFSK
ncbi:50S ribosomal protein L5 [Candidatus Gottesmanbacteria bacterium]|nr:50S ribosomal protein L5 [Candidatus Gottesmanbacteria bacterium]MBI5465604.1 50S ribosomal protein L5 [Candidatus Gottesmanbacteria bacterium]